MRIGAQLYTVNKFTQTESDFDSTVKKVADMGYDSVQAWPAAGMTAQDLQNMLSDLGLENCSSGGSFDNFIKGNGFKEAVESAGFSA